MTTLLLLQTTLAKEGLIAEIHGDAVETFRDWSYSTGINPWDDVEAYSDVIKVSFTGSAFIAADEEGKEIAREIVLAEYDPEAGITENDIENTAESMAETIAGILPERDLLAEREEAYADYMAEAYA